MVMQSVGLHDDVTVTRTGDGGVTLACDKPFVPTDGRNLAVRAAEHFFACTGLACDGLHIALKKRIPVAAGLAGGSTDAAAVLRALDTLYGAGLSTDALCGMGLALGADVPYCLVGGTMLAEGIGEVLTPLPPMPDCWAVPVQAGLFGLDRRGLRPDERRRPARAAGHGRGAARPAGGRLCGRVPPAVQRHGARHRARYTPRSARSRTSSWPAARTARP